MRVDDFVLLGRTVPEKSKKYGYKVCSAGYSAELGGLMRVYPLPVQNGLRQWSRLRLELERPRDDSRCESWALKTRDMASVLEVGSDKTKRASYAAFFDGMLARSVEQLNRDRASLGIIKPRGFQCHFGSRRGMTCPSQQMLFDCMDDKFGAEAADLVPQMVFEDADGEHCLQVREIGAYEWIRTNRDRAAQLWMNYRLNKDRDVYLLVGNMASHRNVWLIINIITFKQEATLFA